MQSTNGKTIMNPLNLEGLQSNVIDQDTAKSKLTIDKSQRSTSKHQHLSDSLVLAND